MPNPYFTFKQFTVWQDKTAMKVGTDGVLLGVLTRVDAEQDGQQLRVLDIGTGTGLVALMMAQRLPNARVCGIDIDNDAAEQARENFAASPFAARLVSLRADATKYETDEPYDMIVSNPPYFTRSLTCPDQKRTIARHAVDFTYADLACAASRLLADEGRLTIIVPTDAIDAVEACCQEAGLYMTHRTDIYPNHQKPSKRVVAEFGKEKGLMLERHTLVLEDAPRLRSTEYTELTRDFYLK